MRFVMLGAAFVGLASCSGEAESLERQYSMAVGADEKCRIAREASDAWLKREDRAKYLEWSGRASTECAHARR